MENFNSIAISSRVRLARNLSGFKFGPLLLAEEARLLISTVFDALEKAGEFDYYLLADMSTTECNSLLERHIISKELIENRDIAGLALSELDQVYIMLCEEDHIREQCIEEGFNLYKPLRKLAQIDNVLLSELKIAYDSEFGFLTSCPTNLGAGMRASVMLFLPALEKAGQMENLFEQVKIDGLTIRGIYGEGSLALGSYYQVSNQKSLGLSENEIVDKVSEFVYMVAEMEELARKELKETSFDEIKDEVQRAYALLRGAYLLSEEEMIIYLSKLRLGEALGILQITDMKAFSNLYFEGASANLKVITNFDEDKKENRIRSEYISCRLEKLICIIE